MRKVASRLEVVQHLLDRREDRPLVRAAAAPRFDGQNGAA
jgi:hypothetical protein